MVKNNNKILKFLLFCPQLKDIQFPDTEEEQKPENIHISEAAIVELSDR